jgi:hypothetical protein
MPHCKGRLDEWEPEAKHYASSRLEAAGCD